MFKKILATIVKMIQRILITVFLIILYFFGFGITLFFLVLFKRKLIYSSIKNIDSSWLKAEGYDQGLEESLRQS